MVVVPTPAGAVSPAVKGIVFGELDVTVHKNRVCPGHVPMDRREVALRNSDGFDADKGIGGDDAPSIEQRLADRNHVGGRADGGLPQGRRSPSEQGRIFATQPEGACRGGWGAS